MFEEQMTEFQLFQSVMFIKKKDFTVVFRRNFSSTKSFHFTE